MAVAGTYRIALDPLGGDLLSLPPLQRLIYTQDERPLRLRDESLYKQSQQDATRLSGGLLRSTQHSVVAMPPLLLIQIHSTQGGTDCLFPWGEDRTYQEYLDIPPGSFG